MFDTRLLTDFRNEEVFQRGGSRSLTCEHVRQEIEVSAQKRERNTTLKDKLERVKAVVLCGRWSEEKRIFLYGVVMQQCSGHVDEDVNTISGGECHGSHIDKCYRDSIGTYMRLRGSLSVEGRELKS
ncbi:unnamed protein product [Prunus armeniaca]